MQEAPRSLHGTPSGHCKSNKSRSSEELSLEAVVMVGEIDDKIAPDCELVTVTWMAGVGSLLSCAAIVYWRANLSRKATTILFITPIKSAMF